MDAPGECRLMGQLLSDEEAGDHKEDVDPDVTAGSQTSVDVVQHDEQDRDRA